MMLVLPTVRGTDKWSRDILFVSAVALISTYLCGIYNERKNVRKNHTSKIHPHIHVIFLSGKHAQTSIHTHINESHIIQASRLADTRCLLSPTPQPDPLILSLDVMYERAEACPNFICISTTLRV